MEKIISIQKREKLNEVYAVDEKGNGGANHEYKICRETLMVSSSGAKMELETIGRIQLQNGARNTAGAIEGVIDSDLLEIVRHRLKAFQDGPFASEYNAKALEHIEEALMWMNRRVEDRIERNVLGRNEK